MRSPGLRVRLGDLLAKFVSTFRSLAVPALTTHMTVDSLVSTVHRRLLALTYRQSLILPLNQIINSHDEVAKSHLLRAKLMLNTRHGLNQELILLIFLILVDNLLLRVQLDELLLEILFCVGFVLALAIDFDDLTETGSVLALSDLNDDAHDDVLEQVASHLAVEHLLSLLDFLLWCFQVVNGVGALTLKIAVLGETDTQRELVHSFLGLGLFDLRFVSARLVFSVLANECHESIEIESQHFDISDCFHLSVHLIAQKDRAIVDHRSWAQTVNHELIVVEL